MFKIINFIKSNIRRIVTNDKVTKTVFNMSQQEKKFFAENRAVGLMVDEKIKDSVSTVIVSMLDEYTGHAKLNEFDKAVYGVCISAQYYGNNAITINQIYRYLGGNDTRPIPESNEKEIEDSLFKLMKCLIKVDCEQVAQKSKYKFGDLIEFREVILPGRYEVAEINGQTVKSFIFTSESPLFRIANIKKQFLNVPIELYKIAGLRNTPRTIAVKEYVIQRVAEYQRATPTARRHLSDNIQLAKIYDAADIDDADKNQRQDVRLTVEKVMDNLVNNHVLESYQFIRRGNAYHSVKFAVIEGDNRAENALGNLAEIGT